MHKCSGTTQFGRAHEELKKVVGGIKKVRKEMHGGFKDVVGEIRKLRGAGMKKS